MMHKGLSDSKFPGNLLDSDFNEQTTTLPPSRPDTDFTAVSYLIAKGRIAGVFGLIADHGEFKFSRLLPGYGAAGLAAR